MNIYKALKEYKQFIIAAIFFSILGTGVTFALPYVPTDQELDPTCAPGDTDCYVSILPDQTSNTGKLLFTDGTNPAWASNLYWDETNDRLGVGTVDPTVELEVVGDIVSKGTKWTSRTSAADNQWTGVVYGNGLFVAVATSGTGNRVMTSPDGINWTARAASADSQWRGITYGNGLFVAVARDGDRVMTSPDGITWTARTPAANLLWRDVIYGNGLFVAVSEDGTGNRVMTSPDGINWTSRTSAADNIWISVAYGNGLFVAVSLDGTGDRIMTSPDGITWTSRTNPVDNNWTAVTYGNGLFVAVSETGTGDRIMTSPDGITWTSRTNPVDNNWRTVEYGNGLFVSTSGTGTGDRVMTSVDGINWKSRTSAADNSWIGLTYGNGVFVAVSASGTGNRVMTSGKLELLETSHNNIYQGGLFSMGNVGIGNSSPNETLDIYSSSAARIRIEHNSPSGGIIGIRNTGTRSAPIAPVNTAGLLEFSTMGWDGTSFINGRTGSTRFVASEDWSATANGTELWIHVTPNTTTTSITSAIFKNAGELVVGTNPNTITAGGRLHIQGADDTSATNTAIFHNSTGTSNSLVIRDDGNVGIGIASPGARLDVSGGRLNVGGTYNATAGSDYFVTDINPMITAGANNQRIALVRLRDRGAALTGGFTGVVRPLLISENNAGGQHHVQLFEAGLRIGDYSGGVTAIVNPNANLELQGFTSNSSGYSIRVTNSNDNELFNVRNDRRVGVGTSAPSSIFEIVNNASGTAAKSYITSYDNLSEGSSLSLRQANGTESSPTAVALLSSLGTIEAQGHTGSGWGTVGRIRFMSVENYTPTATGSWLEFATTPVGTNTAVTSMILHDSGHLAIGDTSNSAYQLNVGSSSIAGIVARFENSTGTCDINPTNTALICSSDLTLKKNINSIDSSLSLLIGLRPVTYNWNTQDDTTTPTPGFIAQEVETIFPFLVTTDTTTNLKSLNYTLFTPYIIKSIQELNTNLTSLDPTKPNTLASLIKEYLGDALNGLERLFVKTVITEGVQTKDTATGETYCIVVTNGQLNHIPGDCGNPTQEEIVIPVPEPEPESTPEEEDVIEEEPVVNEEEVIEPAPEEVVEEEPAVEVIEEDASSQD